MGREVAILNDRALHGSRILVTGAHGFIGMHVARAASRACADVVGLVRDPRSDPKLDAGPIAYEQCDVADPDEVFGALQRYEPEIIVHAAGATQRGKGREAWQANVASNVATTLAVVAAAAAIAPDRRPVVVAPGSQREYGTAAMPWTEERSCEPVDAYGATKLAATVLFLGARGSDLLNASVVRLPIVFGPGQTTDMFVPELIRNSLAGSPMRMTPGEQRRRFLFAPDAAAALLTVARRCRDGFAIGLLNAPAYEPMTLRSFVERVVAVLGRTVDVTFGAIEYRPDERLDAWPDTSLAESMDPWLPLTPLDEALRETIDWFAASPAFVARPEGGGDGGC